MKKFVLAPALAALAMFFWGFLYWGAPHHLPYKSLSRVSDESSTAEAIGKLLPATGAYLIPSPLSGEEKMAEMMKRGPMVQVFITKEGLPAMDPGVMVKGYLHMFVLAAFLSALLCGLEKAFEGWTCRVRFCASIGLLVAISDLGGAIWWRHAWGWTISQAVYDLVAYTLAGLVLAKFVTPKATSPAA